MNESSGEREKTVVDSLLDLPNIAWTSISTFVVIIGEYIVGAVLQINNFMELDKWLAFISTNLTIFWNFITEKSQQISEFLVLDALPKFMELLSNIWNTISSGCQSVFEFLNEYFNLFWHFVIVCLDKWPDFISTNFTIFSNFMTEKAQKAFEFLGDCFHLDWDYLGLSTQFQDAFEFLQKEKEFTLWMVSFFIFLCFHCCLFNRRPSLSVLISRFIQVVQFNCLFGCFLFLVEGMY